MSRLRIFYCSWIQCPCQEVFLHLLDYSSISNVIKSIFLAVTKGFSSEISNINKCLYIFNLDLYETWNLSFLGPNWLIQFTLSLPSVWSVPPGTLYEPELFYGPLRIYRPLVLFMRVYMWVNININININIHINININIYINM